MFTTTQFSSLVKSLVLSVALLFCAVISVTAQTSEVNAKSRIAVVATQVKTNIWVSDFPKSTSVVLFDEESNIIAVQSTNEFGAAFISLPTSITSTIFAKTLNGEVSVSNKAVVKGSKSEENIAAKQPVANTTKA
jgi:hypothetical protein